MQLYIMLLIIVSLSARKKKKKKNRTSGTMFRHFKQLECLVNTLIMPWMFLTLGKEHTWPCWCPNVLSSGNFLCFFSRF